MEENSDFEMLAHIMENGTKSEKISMENGTHQLAP